MGRLGAAFLVLVVGWPASTLGTSPSGRRRSSKARITAVVGVRNGQPAVESLHQVLDAMFG